MYHAEGANPVSEWGALATLARITHVLKSLLNFPWDMDAFVVILCAAENNVHVSFHCGVSTQLSVIKLQVSPATKQIFLCNQDICASTMGCKRGFTLCFYIHIRMSVTSAVSAGLVALGIIRFDQWSIGTHLCVMRFQKAQLFTFMANWQIYHSLSL